MGTGRPRVSFDESAANAAALFVSRRQLIPPIDVESLLAEFAEIEAVSGEWPTPDSDAAVVYGNGSRRPRVFYNNDVEHQGRVRFTLAHELGHIRLPWHCGSMTCSPLGGWQTERTTSDEAHTTAEREADTFASGILLPRIWLRNELRTHRDNMNTLLGAVQIAEASATATLWAIRDCLPVPGWVFQLNNRSRFFQSRGTLSHGGALYRGSDQGRLFLNRHSVDRGSVQLGRNVVRWWRLVGPYTLPDIGDPRTRDRELLQKAMAAQGIDTRREQSINGKVGGGTTKYVAGGDAAEVYAGLRYRFTDTSDYALLLDDEYFTQWLARRSTRIAERTS